MTYTDEELAALLEASRHHWERKRPPERCQHCGEHPPVWLVLDPKKHNYWDTEGSTPKRRMDGYLLCDSCKRNAVKWAKRGNYPRTLKTERWSV